MATVIVKDLQDVAAFDQRNGGIAARLADSRLRGAEKAWDSATSVPAPTLALWVVLASVTMLFAGFTSAYLVRRTATDWVPIYSPPILALNTVLLVLSSAALERAKSWRTSGQLPAFRTWLKLSMALGAAFVAGQVFVWRQLSAAGIFLSSSPHGSFFYMLTAMHAVHVFGGLAFLLYALLSEGRFRGTVSAVDPAGLLATYWHFVTGIWIFLYLLLFVWR